MVMVLILNSFSLALGLHECVHQRVCGAHDILLSIKHFLDSSTCII